MADIFLKCPECSKHLVVGEKGVGKSFACPECGNAVSVSEPDLRFQCPSCKWNFLSTDEFRDETFDCPNCDQAVVVPLGEESGALVEDGNATPEIEASGPRCPECGASNPQGTQFCMKCGKPMSEDSMPTPAADSASGISRSCPNCKKSIPSEAVICVNCGTDLSSGKRLSTDIPEQEGVVNEAVGRTSHRNSVGAKLLLSLVSVVVIVCLGVGIASWHGRSKKKSLARASQEWDNTLRRQEKESAEGLQILPSSIKGSIRIVFKGMDLPLKQVPVYLIPMTDEFKSQYDRLAAQALPLLTARSRTSEYSSDWTALTERLIEIEKRRVITFRKFTDRTVYADNNGMFAFFDLKAGAYLVLVEGTVGDRMTIWSSQVDLETDETVSLDFGESSVGATERVYAHAAVSSRESQVTTTKPLTDYDELCDRANALYKAGHHDEAVVLFRQGATAGHALSQFNLGVSFLQGRGWVDEDPERAVYWFKESARQGLAEAENALGFCYEDGYGVTKDLTRAAYWYDLAARQGHQKAMQNLATLRTQAQAQQQAARRQYISRRYPRFVGVYKTTQQAALVADNMNARQTYSLEATRESLMGGGAYEGSRVGQYRVTYDRTLNGFVVYQQ